MKLLLPVRGCGMLFVAVALAGCSGASWKSVQVDSPYQPPKAVSIAISASQLSNEASQALASALVDELTSDGVGVTLVPPTVSADANLTIARWDPGSRGLRWLVGFGAGQGEIIVTVQSGAVDGVVDGWVTGGWFGGDSLSAAEAAGHLIGKTIAYGEKAQRAPKNPGPRGVADAH